MAQGRPSRGMARCPQDAVEAGSACRRHNRDRIFRMENAFAAGWLLIARHRSLTALQVAVFSERGLATEYHLAGAGVCNSSNPVSIRGTELSMYATSSADASAGSSNC